MEIPTYLLVSGSGNHIADIVVATYPGLLDHVFDFHYYEQRAIFGSDFRSCAEG